MYLLIRNKGKIKYFKFSFNLSNSLIKEDPQLKYWDLSRVVSLESF